MKNSQMLFMTSMFFIGLSYLPDESLSRLLLLVLGIIHFIGMVMNIYLETKEKWNIK